jgi:hypothetical protein
MLLVRYLVLYDSIMIVLVVFSPAQQMPREYPRAVKSCAGPQLNVQIPPQT